jgi:hydroxyacid-oxoacid transhydrogenase
VGSSVSDSRNSMSRCRRRRTLTQLMTPEKSTHRREIRPSTGSAAKAARKRLVTEAIPALERVVRLDTSSIKYGRGATREVGWDLRELGANRVMLVTDRRLVDGPVVAEALDALDRESLDVVVFDAVRVEPTDTSFREAIEFARSGRFDGYVAVGGGSSIDTAKAADLYATHPADFLAYVNPPIGEGRPVPGPLRPLVAIPTTAGTGSETTGVAIFDFEEIGAKTGIAHRFLRPSLGIVDPDNVRSMPPMVAACSGFDVLCHALESFTNLPFDRRPAPPDPGVRPAYQGRNPVSDVWAAKTIELSSRYIVEAVRDAGDGEAREQMLLAATFAGIGFGNAGLHLCHGMSYPIAGQVRDYRAPDYPDDHPIIPHGMSVVLTAPAVFRFTASADPVRHREAARLMGLDIRETRAEDAGELIAGRILELMRATGMPNGLTGVGYESDQIDSLVAGALPQQRVLKLSPRPVGEAELRELFRASMTCW